MALAAALALLAPAAGVALGDGVASGGRSSVARVVEIRVSGDAAALARVRITARELLLRLDVQPNVKASDEPETRADEATPLVIAHVDLRSVASPSIDIEDGTTRQELTRRSLSDVVTLETGVESLLHVLYLAVESALQVAAGARPSLPTKKPAPPPPERKARLRVPSSSSGLDFGPLLRLSSLGGTRVVPGGGVLLEPRTGLGRGQLGVMLSGVVHGTSELSFERGAVALRPLQARLVSTLDWLLSSEVSGCFGLGGGLDAFMVEPVQAPDAGRVVAGDSAIDPVLTALVGARVPVAGRAFLSALASLDLDLVPTSFVARVGEVNRPIMQLPRLRGGFTLALSFSAVGSRRFAATQEVTQ